MKNLYLVLASFLGLISIANQGGNFNVMAQTPSSDYTVAQAISLVESGKAPTSEVTVVGYIAKVESVNLTNNFATYWIVDNMTDVKGLQVYNGKWLNGGDFTSATQLGMGAKVKVTGKLQDYKGTPEFSSGSVILEYTAQSYEPPTITVKEGVEMITEGKIPVASTVRVSAYLGRFDYRYLPWESQEALYYIVDNMTDNVALSVLSKGPNGLDFCDMNPLALPGDKVTVEGDLYNYSNNPSLIYSSMINYNPENYKLPEYTVQEAFALVKEKKTTASAVRVTGYVSRISFMGFNTTGATSYYITDDLDGLVTNQNFFVYDGFGLNGLHFSDGIETLVNIGDKVTVEGAIVNNSNGNFEIG